MFYSYKLDWNKTTDEVNDLWKEFESLYKNFDFKDSFGCASETCKSIFKEYEVKSDKESYEVSIELPGVKRESINLSTNSSDNLLLNYKNKKDKEVSFKIVIPKDYDISKTTSKLDLGILTITVPIKESSKPKNIVIH